MKVTNTIKEYIQKKTREAYAKRMDEAETAYQAANQMVKSVKATVTPKIDERLTALLEKTAKDIVKLGDDLGAHVTVDVVPYRYNDNEYHITYEFSSPEADEARQRIAALKKERADIVEDIIVSLELGADKNELERRLANL